MSANRFFPKGKHLDYGVAVAIDLNVSQVLLRIDDTAVGMTPTNAKILAQFLIDKANEIENFKASN